MRATVPARQTLTDASVISPHYNLLPPPSSGIVQNSARESVGHVSTTPTFFRLFRVLKRLLCPYKSSAVFRRGAANCLLK
jgi:hypothetical protein